MASLPRLQHENGNQRQGNHQKGHGAGQRPQRIDVRLGDRFRIGVAVDQNGLGGDDGEGRTDRSAFFKDELENWFVLCQSEGVEPLAWKGSYAGAIGMAQFMPSSFNKYAVDLDGDGHVNLHHSAADVIGSVANYLAEFGWKRGLAVRFDVKPPQDLEMRAALLAADVLPTFTVAEMADQGVILPPTASAVDSALALVELQNGDAAPSYVAGTANFYAITRYNRSSYYAMAVVSLGEAVRRAANGAGA